MLILDSGWGNHHLVALAHVANNLMQVIDAVLKSQRPYDPHIMRKPVILEPEFT
jgi:hypothetical protein